ncbi:type IX secretion system sortase PorU [Taibaiella soli]|uniref:Gingipain domain-containing protein n=1 Tax=Taibaiella soli TaxID=1649169 RepID=A0A2W2A8C3_9BACT|nr:type IX secretion system sortase PorU [Taibaiella soli]PZF71511.1 hypothetical protein DN068_17860 [Taibaiella soli]
MRNLLSFLLSSCLVTTAWASSTETYHIAASDINNGYVVKKVWLKEYAVPRVQLINPAFTAVSALPQNVTAQNPQDVKVVIGEVRKRYFAIVKIPVYSTQGGAVRQLTDFTLVTDEQAAPATTPKALARTTGTVTNSPLASGSWYKISIPQRGVYKIDYDFIKTKLGVDPAGINTANIRVYGNGGTMLPENNAIPRPADLTEDAIVVNDGGDGKFGSGDYILFYANGPVTWAKDSVNGRFTHSNNLYENKSYYFLNFDLGAGKRVGAANNAAQSNIPVTSFNDYQMHDTDLVNLGVVGKTWWGENFSTLPGKSSDYTFNFNLGQVIDSVSASMSLGCVSSVNGNTFNVAVNGQTYGGPYYMGQIPVDISGTPVSAVVTQYVQYKLPASNSESFYLKFNSPATDANGYLDYIELNYRRALSFAGGQMNFRDWNSVGSGNVAGYSIQNTNSNTQVWDITDPINPASISGNLNGGTYSFAQDASQLREFVTFDGSQFYTPDFVSKVDNQNIHGQSAVDLIVVTYPDFLDAANQIADFHRQHDNMRVLVATTGQIYNEFSSGSQDISAIRDAAKMFYDRAGNDTTQMPRYLLLFGDASYDYKDRIGANTNYVPTFESQESISLGNSYGTDDFFGFLGANENIEDITIANSFDIGVGRIPVATTADANNVAAKIIHYKSAASLGPWRLTNTYVADNEDDAGAHLAQAEEMVAEVDSNVNVYNDVKVYLDNLPFVSTPGGARCPDANKAINDQVFKGTFIINYNGHGGPTTLAHERILTADDFNQWKNIDKLPFMITATCDFARFDDPSYVSAGEKLVIKSDGGAIALLTTTQLTYAYANRMLNLQFLNAQFQRVNGTWNTFGDAFREGKNVTYESNPLPDYSTLVNFRKFTLLGDPALEPDFPEYSVATDSIKTLDGNPTDTVSALGGYLITGKVKDHSGNLMSSFNGQVYVTIYDKARTITLYTKVYNTKRTYLVQDNIIYKGKATVENGRFSVKFVAPKDLNYDFGKGRISYYADNGTIDAAGIDTSMTVGGYSDNPVVDNTPPIVKPYMNDSFFVDGGITGSNTLLFVSLFDETGINISGNSVGHDLTAVLDGDVQNPYVLNDYYENAPNDYQHGYVNFPITGLADGQHVLHVKAWDVNNNSGEGDVHFVVYNGEVMKIGNLMNYPNPFGNVSKETHFVFEHNHPEETLTAKLLIYNMGGQLVRSFQETFTPSGSRSHEITWDGTDQAGAQLPDGVYVYRINISTSTGIQATAYQKLVLIR